MSKRDKLEEAAEVLRVEFVSAPGHIESVAYLLRRGRADGIPPQIMKQAAGELGVEIEWHVHPETHRSRTYWRLDVN